jgi:hypothetical protein
MAKTVNPTTPVKPAPADEPVNTGTPTVSVPLPPPEELGEEDDNTPPPTDLHTDIPEPTVSATPAPKATASAAKVVTSPTKMVRVRCLITESCNIAKQKYSLVDKQVLQVPEDVATILQNSGWVVRIA